MKKTLEVVEKPDSLTIGTPTNGQVKIYTDFDDLEGTKKKIDNAKEAMEYAKIKLGGIV